MIKKVEVIGVWGSPFSRRVEIALKMKGIEYEFIEENLHNKSELLLKSNPIYKKIPVLFHNGTPIVESLLILEYIDETWKKTPLLPSGPFERAQARFWASFFDDTLWPSMRNARVSKGEENKKAMKELHKLLTILENEIKGSKFFGGSNIGYVDIVGLFLAYWFPIVREAIGKDLVLTFADFPNLCNWRDRLLSCQVIKDNLPDKGKLLEFFRAVYIDTSTT